MVLRLSAVDRSLCATSETTDLARLLRDSAASGRRGVLSSNTAEISDRRETRGTGFIREEAGTFTAFRHQKCRLSG